MKKKEGLEVVRGSGNVFRDLGHENADAEQFKAILAAEIIKALDREHLTVRGPRPHGDSGGGFFAHSQRGTREIFGGSPDDDHQPARIAYRDQSACAAGSDSRARGAGLIRRIGCSRGCCGCPTASAARLSPFVALGFVW